MRKASGEIHLNTHVRRLRAFGVLYGAVLILSLHWSLVIYVNASNLDRFVSPEAIGLLYALGSAITIIAFLLVSRVLRLLGNYALTVSLAVLEILILIGLAYADTLRFAIPLFILHQAVIPLLLFNLDVFVERAIGADEKVTGGTRGALLTIMSLAGAVAPLAAGYLLGDGEPRFHAVYLASAACMVAFCYFVLRYFRTFTDSPYPDIHMLAALRHFFINRNLRLVFFAHSLLQLFFAWMVIYLPLYLVSVIGFSWSEVGIILFFGLLAYIICEYPIGALADTRLGEKEMMAGGFIVLAATTAGIAMLSEALLIPWILLMFATRVGASLVEVTTESYFFKQTKASDAQTISFFRTSRPLSYMLGALLGSATLLFVPFSYAFLVLALVMTPGILCALLLVDTR